MKVSTVGSILATVVALSAGIWIGRWSGKPTIDELLARNNALAVSDSVTHVQLSEARDAFERISFEYRNSNELFASIADSMNHVIVDLTAYIHEQNHQIEFLSSMNTRLEYELETALDNVTVEGDTVSAEISDRSNFEDGYIATDGKVTIDTNARTGSASLKYEVGLTPTIALSRDDAGVAKCDVSFGDMPVTIDDILCMNNIDPDLPTRGKINIPQVGIGIGIGVAAVLLAAIL